MSKYADCAVGRSLDFFAKKVYKRFMAQTRIKINMSIYEMFRTYNAPFIHGLQLQALEYIKLFSGRQVFVIIRYDLTNVGKVNSVIKF